MSGLPEPMTPPDCDLRGYDYMPMFGTRLFGSAFYSLALQNPRAGLAAQKLWWEAWQQCPAGSLPADDFTLCRLADFGSDTKAWAKAKKIALHGFVLCSDSRLYHPLLCKAAISAYDRRVKDRLRKAKWRAGQDGDGHDSPEDVTRDKTRDETQDETGTGAGHDAGRDGYVRAERRGEERRGDNKSVERTSGGLAHARTHDARRVGPMPTANDPPAAWFGLADKTEIDDRDGIEKPVVGGWYVDGVAQRVCLEARISFTRAVDWVPLFGWLREGFSPEEHIYPAIRRLAARPGYQPPRFLTYFDQAVREARAA